MRARLVAAVAIIWGCLHFGVDRYVLARGPDDPLAILTSQAGALRGLAALAVLVLLAGGLGRLVPRPDRSGTLFVFGLVLALWAATGGTMDDWLKLRHPEPGPGSAGPYLALLGDYAALVVACVVLVVWSGYGGPTSAPGWPVACPGLDVSAGEARAALLGILLNVLVTAVLVYALAGPAVGHTYRGQVIFSVAAACTAGAMLARRLTHVRHPIWFWPVPIVVGALGLLLAAWRPVLPPPYENINVIPAWRGLARPLPAEMVGVGLVAVILTLRTAERLHGAMGERPAQRVER